MLGKKGSNPDDDFDFDFGGDEMFDIDDPFGKNEKPPKGVKGYLKNVVKSIKNIGIKLGSEYLPDAKNLLDDLKEDDEDNSDLKSLNIAKIKSEASKYTNEAKNVVKDLKKDVKQRIETGYFFKSEDDMYGDINFGDDFEEDSDLGDLSMGDDENPAPDSTESGESPKAKTSMARVAVKSAKAQSIINMRLASAQINATVGATQAHIQSERTMFNQNILLESEHHRQKMLVMKNIASNVGKIIKQNNVSLKAQMEYSLKSLAFSNDIAAMLKEIRNVQWDLYKPKEDEEHDFSTNYNKIFGNGFNKSKWLNNFLSRSKNNAFGGNLDSILGMGEMLGSMSGFGISTADMIKSMAGDMVFKNVADLFMPTAFKKNLGRINTAIAGAPGAINNILGSLAQNGLKKGGFADTFLSKLPFGSTAKGLISTIAGYAHVDDMAIDKTDRYKLKDPSKPHPFDNLAHKVLTEVIPRQLAKIEAGVNNHEEQYFDYDKNNFVGISTVKNKLKRQHEEAVEYTGGYSEASKSIEGDIKKGTGLVTTMKEIGLDTTKSSDAVRSVIKSFFKSGMQLTSENLKYMSDPNDPLGYQLLSAFAEGMGMDLSDERIQKNSKKILGKIIDGFKDLLKNDHENAIEFQKSATTYQHRYNSGNIAMEEDFGKFGQSSIFDTFAGTDQLNRQLKIAKDRRDKALNLVRDGKKDGVDLLYKTNLKKFQEYDEDYRNLLEDREGIVGLVNDKSGSTDNYEIAQLKNTSSNSVINNIYKLLVDGLIVYPNSNMPSDVSKRYETRRKVLGDIISSKIAEEKAEKDSKEARENDRRDSNAESLEMMREWRKHTYEDHTLRDKLEKIPFLGRIVKFGNNIGETLTSKSSDFVASQLEKMYGIYPDEEEFTENSKLAKQIRAIGGDEAVKAYKNAIDNKKALQDKIDKAKNPEEKAALQEQMNNLQTPWQAVSQYASDVTKEKGFFGTVKQIFGNIRKTDTVNKGIERAKNAVKTSKETITNTGKSAIETTKNIAKETYNNGLTGGLKFTMDTAKSFGKNTFNSIKNTEQFKSLQKAFDEEKIKLDDFIKNESSAHKTVDKLVKAGKLSKEEASNIFKTIRNEGFTAGLNRLKDDLVTSKAGITTRSGLNYLANTEAGQKVTGTFNNIKNSSVVKRTQEKVSKIKSSLTGKLGDLKVGNKTLSETLADINNAELMQQLKNTKDPVEKAKLIVKYGGDEVSIYKNKLTDFINENAQKKGILGKTFTGVTGVLFGKNAIDSLKKERQEGTLEDQKLDKEEAEQKENQKKHLSFLEKISQIPALLSGGIKLDKETMKNIDESNMNAAATMAEASSGEREGIMGKIDGLLNQFGLGDSKLGRAVKKIPGGKSILSRVGQGVAGVIGGEGAKKALAKGGLRGLGKNLSRNIAKNGLKSFSKNAAKGIAGGALKGSVKLAGKGTVGLAKLAGRGAVGSVKLVGKGLIGGTRLAGKGALSATKGLSKAVGKGNSMFFQLFDKFIEAILKKFPGGKFIIKGIVEPIKKGITKLIGNLASKLAMSTATIGSIVAAVAMFGAGVAKGAATAKKDLNLGKDMKPTASMRLICGLATGFNSVLFGIPDIIAKTIFKYKSFAQWMYEKFGNKAEKASIERYHKYCAMKAKIYGIDNFQNLIDYENRNVLDKVKQIGIQFLTLGLAKNNDEKDASTLGFNSVDIYKYWKEKKYEPLEDLRKTVAEAYGGEKVVDSVTTFTADKNNDHEISEEEQDEADDQQNLIQNQQDFRQDFLTQARKWVIDNKLAWLNTKCNAQQFKKYTGKDAKEILTAKQKLGKVGNAAKKALPFAGVALAGVAFGPLGLVGAGAALAIKNRKKIANFFKGGKNKDITANNVSSAAGLKQIKTTTAAATAAALGKSKEEIQEMMDQANTPIGKSMSRIYSFLKKLYELEILKSSKGYNSIKEVFNKITKAMADYGKKNESYAKDLQVKTSIFTDKNIDSTVTRTLKEFLNGKKDPAKYMEIAIPQTTDKIKLIGGVIAMIKLSLPSAEAACNNTFNKTMRKTVFDILNLDKEQASNDNYLVQKAKILGLTVDGMLKYEKKLNENTFGQKVKNFFGNFFGGGADKADMEICKFRDLEVFKFWREEKYEPLRKLEETTAHKFGDIDDLRSDTPKDPEAQKKFRMAYIKAASQYVKDRGLEWLTYNTTKEEYEKRKKSKTLYLKADSDVKHTDNTKKTLGQRISSYFFSSNRDTRGNAKQMYQNNNNVNFVELSASDTKSMEKSLQDEYKYDQKAMAVMGQASSSIKSFWKSISPNFYGDQAPVKVGNNVDGISSDGMLTFSGKGGPDGVSEGLITKVRDRYIKTGSSANNSTTKTVKNDISNKLDDSYGLNEPKIDRMKVMNSITNDFAKKFGNELNKRLDILEEMHRENLRHNKVAENFYNALIALVQSISSNTSNIGRTPQASQLDGFINAIIK